MILTCPDCATRYFVDDARLGAGGKTVRCAACGARWTATFQAEPEIELAVIPEYGAAAIDSFDTSPTPPEETRGFPEALPKNFRAKAAEKTAMKRAVVHGVVWACLLAVLAGALAASIVFRVEVVRLVPRAASAYAMAGLKVNAIGLTFENVSARPALQDGRSALVVSGEIRNIEGKAVTTPPLRINVLSRTGARVATSVNAVADPRIAAGQSYHFVIPVLDPPPTAENVEVVFELGAKARAHAIPAAKAAAPAPKVAAAPTLRPAASEAEPAPEPAVLLPTSYVAPQPPAPQHGEHP